MEKDIKKFQSVFTENTFLEILKSIKNDDFSNNQLFSHLSNIEEKVKLKEYMYKICQQTFIKLCPIFCDIIDLKLKYPLRLSMISILLATYTFIHPCPEKTIYKEKLKDYFDTHLSSPTAYKIFGSDVQQEDFDSELKLRKLAFKFSIRNQEEYINDPNNPYHQAKVNQLSRLLYRHISTFFGIVQNKNALLENEKILHSILLNNTVMEISKTRDLIELFKNITDDNDKYFGYKFLFRNIGYLLGKMKKIIKTSSLIDPLYNESFNFNIRECIICFFECFILILEAFKDTPYTVS
uniref:NR LBD domain-containing protein n=1 Tax=Parastrongyloides trichosuri TaxID=131310 RepID=A0A0N5A4F7_PARTI